jgi:flagellar basal-body rod protein FlgB
VTISFHKALGVYESALRLRSQRAEILSGNLVNADTPNFKARDFNFHAALDRVMAGKETGSLNLTRQQHLPAPGEFSGVGQLQYRTPTQPSIDGNTVDEHLEHAEFMSNSLEFQTAFTMLNSRFKGLLTAIRGD